MNKDERLDINEFRNLIVQNLGRRSGTWSTTAADGAQYTASSHESGGASSYDILANSAGAGAAGNESFNEQSSYAEASGNDTSLASAFGTTGLERNASYTAGASSSLVEASSSQQQQQLQVDPSNPRNLFLDPNPQIIRRQAQHGPLTYTQNVRIRFLQPPPVPPPGVRSFLISIYISLNTIFTSLSSSKKCDLLNHHHRRHFASVNKLLRLLNQNH